MTGSILSLSWENRKNTLCQRLSTLRRKERYTDVTLACEGKFYPAHKWVLSSCSDYFEKVFENTPCKHPVILFGKDVRCSELEALLSYVYDGFVSVAQKDLAHLMKIADLLQIKGLAAVDESPQKKKSYSRGFHDDRISPHPKRQRHDVSVSASQSGRKSTPMSPLQLQLEDDSLEEIDDLEGLRLELAADYLAEGYQNQVNTKNISIKKEVIEITDDAGVDYSSDIGIYIDGGGDEQDDNTTQQLNPKEPQPICEQVVETSTGSSMMEGDNTALVQQKPAVRPQLALESSPPPYSVFQYHVVETVEEKKIRVVSSKWLCQDATTKELLCYFPPYNEVTMRKAARSERLPKSDWDLLYCRQLGSTNDFKRALDLIDSSHDQERASRRPKRKLKRPNRFCGSSDEESADALPIRKKLVNDEESADVLPIRKKPVSDEESADVLPIRKKLVNGAPIIIKGQEQKAAFVTPKTSRESTREVPQFEGSTAFEKFVVSQLERLERNQREMKMMIRETNSKLVQLLRMRGPTGDSVIHRLPEKVRLPLESVEEVYDLEANIIADSELEECLVTYLGMTGGVNVRDCTKRIMKQFLTDRCGRHFNWRGKGDKEPFSLLKLKFVITNAVRKNRFTGEATDAEVEREIKDWLKFSAERDGGRKFRDQMKLQTPAQKNLQTPAQKNLQTPAEGNLEAPP